ncbi:MAG: hypothetical protein K0B15_07390 [Lentimicrobium sp.]|nr:hypothetical protein [Lentimicrobium sp.]
MKYSLWTLEHESIYTVRAYKYKDTNSTKEVDKWINARFYNVASFYHPQEEINAEYLQTFERD